jgi:hypothetical protein
MTGTGFLSPLMSVETALLYVEPCFVSATTLITPSDHSATSASVP